MNLTIETAKKFIRRGELELALSSLSDSFKIFEKKYPELRSNEVWSIHDTEKDSLSSQINHLQGENLQGSLPREHYTNERSRITIATLSLLNDIEKNFSNLNSNLDQSLTNKLNGERVKIKLKLEGNLNEFTYSEFERILHNLLKQLGLSKTELKIQEINSGSIILGMEMPKHAALNMKGLLNNGFLSYLNIQGLDIDGVNYYGNQVSSSVHKSIDLSKIALNLLPYIASLSFILLIGIGMKSLNALRNNNKLVFDFVTDTSNYKSTIYYLDTINANNIEKLNLSFNEFSQKIDKDYGNAEKIDTNLNSIISKIDKTNSLINPIRDTLNKYQMHFDSVYTLIESSSKRTGDYYQLEKLLTENKLKINEMIFANQRIQLSLDSLFQSNYCPPFDSLQFCFEMNKLIIPNDLGAYIDCKFYLLGEEIMFIPHLNDSLFIPHLRKNDKELQKLLWLVGDYNNEIHLVVKATTEGRDMKSKKDARKAAENFALYLRKYMNNYRIFSIEIEVKSKEKRNGFELSIKNQKKSFMPNIFKSYK